MDSIILQLSNLELSIGRTKILNGVDFVVSPGEKLGIIGPNGSGKTTIFNCISGFNQPCSGAVIFNGQDITLLSPAERAKLGIGRVFQNFGIFREMTLLENILIALEARSNFDHSKVKVGGRSLKGEALNYLESVNLANRATEKAGSLSGGQMRLLEITRAVAFGAELFLLDEPTAGVSPKMKHEIQVTLQRLQGSKKTVLIIEHDLNFIQNLCDRIIVIDSGRVAIDGSSESVRRDPRLQEIYFGQDKGANNNHSEQIAVQV